MQVQEYNKFLKEVESFNQLPKKTYEGNKTNPKFETIREKKKLENEQVMKNFYKRNEVKDEDLYIGAFIYTLAKYVGENKVIFSLLDKRQTIPRYKKIEEKDIKSFLKNIKHSTKSKKIIEIQYLTKSDKEILKKTNDTKIEISGNNIPELFEKQVAKNRNKKDIISNGKSLTYEELNNKANQIVSNPKIKIKPNNLCYCIFTSGSTGKPKGVMVEHRNLINYCNVNKFNKEAEVVGTNAKASLALATLTFDVSILEEFMPLLNRGTKVIATEGEIYTPIKLAKLIIENNVEVITCTPSFINNIIDIEKVQQATKNIKKFNIGAESI